MIYIILLIWSINIIFYYYKIKREEPKEIMIKELCDNLQNGDILILAKQKLNMKDLFYHITACNLLNTPYYHIGIVSGDNYVHFVKKNYYPQFNWYCPNKDNGIQISPLKLFLEKYNEKHRPIIKVLRNEKIKEINILEKMTDFCEYQFEAKHLSILLDYYGINSLLKIEKTDKLHCNSFLGVLLEKIGILPESLNKSAEYIPNNICKILEEKGKYKVLEKFVIKY
jgi:hypothetical protein